MASFHPTAIGLYAFVLGLLLESITSWRFLRTLKSRYPELWAHTGYRTMWTDGNLIGAYPTIKYLSGRAYSDRQNPEEVSFCDSHRLPVVWSYRFAVLSVICFFAAMALYGWPPEWA